MNECFSSNHSTPVLIPDDRSSLNSRSDVENTDICQLSLPEASSSNKRWNCFVGNCTKTYTRRRDLWRHILPNHLGYSLSYECYMCRKGGIRGKRQFTSRRDTAITHIHECWKREFKKKPGNEFKKVPEKVPDENYKIIEANQRFFNCRFVGCSYGTHEKKNFEEHVFTNHDNLNNKRLVDYCDHCHKVLRMTRTQLISAHKQKCQKKHALEG
ncbi:hypothetical protein BDA99DRAFT_285491 [Phascolomyces articulosus]|uniref:C2H2-type domain-containing protein n=1 Tax=Phascolomyces articulosus TaxID=60185 RepID=A0AAD5P7K7_9FUNG|nr:hypothetical protein BDA99DRAFT_285491 [Phascolomyces articulosus]